MITNWLPAPDARGPVTCDVCGCRLELVVAGEWRHFRSDVTGQDARGCRPSCADAAHDSSGRAVVEVAAP